MAYTISIKDQQNKGVTKVQIPGSLKEMSGSQYCEWLHESISFHEWQKEQLESGVDVSEIRFQMERLHRMAKMVQAFCEELPDYKPLDAIYLMPVGNYIESLLYTFDVNKVDDIDFEANEATLYKLWAFIMDVVKSSTVADLQLKETFALEVGGETFYLKEATKDQFFGNTIPPRFTVQEAIEVMEVRRKAAAMMEKGEHPNKNVHWEALHRQLAMLALKEGEDLPGNEGELDRFISERVKFFVDNKVSAYDLLRVDFFLSGLLGLFDKTIAQIGFSTRLLSSQKQKKKASNSENSRKKTANPSTV